MSKVRDILGPDRDSEFLQSFVRVGLKADEEGDTPYKSIYTQQKPDLTKQISDGKSEGSDKTPRRVKNVDWFQGLVHFTVKFSFDIHSIIEFGLERRWDLIIKRKRRRRNI